jgi:hypothetical protein
MRPSKFETITQRPLVVPLLAWTAAIAGAVAFVADRPDHRHVMPLVTILIVLWSIAIRSLWVGIWVAEETITVRSWWRTHSFAGASVSRVNAVPYSGLWNGWNEWELEFLAWTPVFVLSDHRNIRAQGSLGFKRIVRRRVDELNIAVGLPTVADRPPPRHLRATDRR